jgi:hypothetical protein
LRSVSEALQHNSLTIDTRGVHVKKLSALDEDWLPDRARNQLLRGLGTVQFPQIILDTDTEVRFSWLLLQRAPRHRQELLALCLLWARQAVRLKSSHS